MKIRLDKNQNTGFTLIEMMVSMTLFITVLAISIGSLMIVMDSNKKAQTMRSALDNLGLAMEEMSRSIRQGRIYHCDTFVTVPSLTQERVCPLGAESIAFEPFYGSTTLSTDQVHYRFATTTGTIQKSINNGATYYDVTSPELEIQHLSFHVEGIDPLGGGLYNHALQHPRVMIVVGGVAGMQPRYQTEFSLQTTITQRAPEI